MQIENNTVVAFHYVLTEIGGDYTEDSRGSDPLYYLHGHLGILPGLEDAMLGHQAGDQFSVTVEPEQGYGLRNKAGIQRVPIKHLTGRKKPAIGEIVLVNTARGEVKATVVKVGKFNVDVDTNHPLAGKSLQFDVEILEVREATMEEVAHRHAHGPNTSAH
ncbi:MAG: peptidylprolyl isomerase [Pseudomonadota bacterium]